MTGKPSIYTDETFLLIMARFDAVDKDNQDIKDSLANHVKDDKEVHAVVSKHSTYWGLLTFLGTPLLIGIIAWFQGLFNR